jgi:hypothetical protein
VQGSEFTTKAATPHEDFKKIVPSLCVVGLNPVAARARVYREIVHVRKLGGSGAPSHEQPHLLRARRVHLSAALVPLLHGHPAVCSGETREHARAHSLGLETQLGR